MTTPKTKVEEIEKRLAAATPEIKFLIAEVRRLEEEFENHKRDWRTLPLWLASICQTHSLLGGERPLEYIEKRGAEGLRNYIGLEYKSYGELNPLFKVMNDIFKERDQLRAEVERLNTNKFWSADELEMAKIEAIKMKTQIEDEREQLRTEVEQMKERVFEMHEHKNAMVNALVEARDQLNLRVAELENRLNEVEHGGYANFGLSKDRDRMADENKKLREVLTAISCEAGFKGWSWVVELATKALEQT